MSTVNANVTAGKEFVPDAEGKTLIEREDLNRLGLPTVTVDLSNSVDAADIKAAAVTAAKLGDDVRAALLQATATVGDEAANVVTVTVQVKDIAGNNLSEQTAAVQWWLSTAAGGAMGGTAPSASAATTGVKIADHTAHQHGLALTDASGTLVLTFTHAGTLELYFNAVVQGRYVAGSKAMNWAA